MFNALPLSARGGGVSTYIHGLLGALAGTLEADLVAAVHPSGRSELPDGVSPLVKEESHGVRRATVSAAGFGSADLTHGLDVDLPLRRPGPTVSTVHDMAIVDTPWAFPRYRVAGERVLLRLALRRADAVIAVSAFTADRVKALVGRDAVVIHSAPGPAMVPPSPDDVAGVRSRYRLPDRFVLHVGNIEPRKDIATLAGRSFGRAAPGADRAQPLGASGPGRHGRDRACASEDLPGLYGAATVVATPPATRGSASAIEAMAWGRRGLDPGPAVVEVAGDGAATFLPGDVEGLAAILIRLLADEACRSELAEAAPASRHPELVVDRRGDGRRLPIARPDRLSATVDRRREPGLQPPVRGR